MCVIIMCIMNGGKKNKYKKRKSTKYKNNINNDIFKNIDPDYIDYLMRSSPTKCQSHYMKCIENNIITGADNFCYPCLDNGNSPDFFYDPRINQWVKSPYH